MVGKAKLILCLCMALFMASKKACRLLINSLDAGCMSKCADAKQLRWSGSKDLITVWNDLPLITSLGHDSRTSTLISSNNAGSLSISLYLKRNICFTRDCLTRLRLQMRADVSCELGIRVTILSYPLMSVSTKPISKTVPAVPSPSRTRSPMSRASHALRENPPTICSAVCLCVTRVDCKTNMKPS